MYELYLLNVVFPFSIFETHFKKNTFIHSKTTQLNKKMYTVFVKRLKEAVPYEISTVLQVHGKALAQTNKDSELVTLIKTRLLEIGVDNSLKRYPNGLKTPLQQRMASSALPIAIQDEVATVIEQYIKKEGTIPTSLLQNYVFRRQWFLATFLPVLFSWKSDRSDLQKAKLNLIQALKEKGKIPEILYQQQMKKEN
ncbi:hypothetical protein BY458DRAFT_501865 [Sporodiniella umbellata]|nr:hypothetical protein BY458DRAFT_501865 [Sporodiniella umbellata]